MFQQILKFIGGEVIAAAAPPRQDGGGVWEALTTRPCERPDAVTPCHWNVEKPPSNQKAQLVVLPEAVPVQQDQPVDRERSLVLKESLPEKLETDIGNLSLEYPCGVSVVVGVLGLILFPRYVIGVIKFVGKAIIGSK